MTSRYTAVFGEVKTALLPFRRETPSPTEAEIARLRDAVHAARALIDAERLRTRRDVASHGALRRGAQYLEERDVANLTAAEDLLRDR